MTVSWFTIIDFTKAQLTRTVCERLFCSLSDSRMGVWCHWSRLQVAVGCKTKWKATCSRLGSQDSGKLLSQLRMEFEEEALLWQPEYSWAQATSRSRKGNVAFLLMIPASIDGRRWYRLHFTIRVSCLLKLCIKPMRYIYHPQRNCYLLRSSS